MSQSVKPSLELKWDDTLKCIQMTGTGFVEGQYYRDNMENGLSLLHEKKAVRWLADMRRQSVLTLVDQDWTVQEWTPRSVKAGIKYSAFVVPTNVLGQMALKRIVSKVGNKEITMAYFDNIEEAKDWLKSF